MKKLTSILCLAVIILVCYIPVIVLACAPNTNSEVNLYPTTTVVYKLDRENDLVTVKDANGNLWQFEGCEDWEINDICSMLMNDYGTTSIYDDEIVMVRYSGTTEGF